MEGPCLFKMESDDQGVTGIAMYNGKPKCHDEAKIIEKSVNIDFPFPVLPYVKLYPMVWQEVDSGVKRRALGHIMQRNLKRFSHRCLLQSFSDFRSRDSRRPIE